MRLFYMPGVCSLSPHILLREMGADFQLDKVDRKTKMNEWLVFIATEVHKNFSPLFRKTADPVFRETLQKRLAFLAQELSQRDFLLGEKLSAADAYLFAVLRWAPRVELELPEPLQRFMARMRVRPAVAEAL